MNNINKLVVLIACSDPRARELAEVLKDDGIIYRRSTEDKKSWSSSIFDQDQDGWVNFVGEFPNHFHVLFFHTGEKDPEGIPTGATFDKEFAFSTGSLQAKEPCAARPEAIAVRRFPEGSCPVKRRHIPEIKDFVKDIRAEPPGFCRADENRTRHLVASHSLPGVRGGGDCI